MPGLHGLGYKGCWTGTVRYVWTGTSMEGPELSDEDQTDRLTDLTDPQTHLDRPGPAHCQKPDLDDRVTGKRTEEYTN